MPREEPSAESGRRILTPAGRVAGPIAARLHASRLALAAALAAFTYLLFPSSPAVDFPVYEVGSVAPDNVIAPFAFRTLRSDEELQREADALMRSVPPVYRAVPSAIDSAKNTLQGLRDGIHRAATTADAAAGAGAVQRAAAPFGVTLSAAEAQYLASPRRRAALFDQVGRAFDRWLPTGIAPAGSMDGVRGEIVLHTGDGTRRLASDSILTFPAFVLRARSIHPDATSEIGDALYLRLLGIAFRPTVVPDRIATALAQDSVRRGIPDVKYEVRAGEKIVGAHEVVGREEHDKLRALRQAIDLRTNTQLGARRIAGAVSFNLLVLCILGLAIRLFRPRVYADARSMIAIAAIGALVIGGGAIVAALHGLHPELVPIALGAVLVSALFDARISLVAAMVFAVLIGGQGVFRGTNALFINLVGGAVAAVSVRAISRRHQAYRWIATVAAAYAVMAVAIGLMLDRPNGDILFSIGLGGLNAVTSVVVALLLLPMAESFTGVETDLTLLEWSDLNRPLLQRLSLEAPGTYAHTVAIANLADAACRAIGANALLARVGAYYHDIGKIAQPQYFVENQARGRNPHDVLAPGDSAAIIRDHVSAGLQLAAEHRIPRALRAFITQHHGTSSIAYFYEKARGVCDNGVAPDPRGFCYPGPIPQTAETAVVMLADGVEAATRVLSEPTAARIRDVVNHIVRQRIEQGQLADAPLTLRQLETIKSEFTRVLAGMYHSRIEYPAESGGVSAEFASR